MTEKSQTCPLCERVATCREDCTAHLVHEFENSFLLVGDHQFHKGYCVLIFKEHVRELHELAPGMQSAFFAELMSATEAIAETFSPWKMNHSSYGNQVPHLHWHIFPRYDTEPDHLQQPWLHSGEFAQHSVSEQQAAELAARIRQNLGRQKMYTFGHDRK